MSAVVSFQAVSFQAGVTAGPWIPYTGADGAGRNASVCGCQSDRSCSELCEVYLPGPVFGVTEVDVDGQVLPLGPPTGWARPASSSGPTASAGRTARTWRPRPGSRGRS